MVMTHGRDLCPQVDVRRIRTFLVQSYTNTTWCDRVGYACASHLALRKGWCRGELCHCEIRKGELFAVVLNTVEDMWLNYSCTDMVP